MESRIANVQTWVRRLRRVAPIAAISQELVRFDTHALVYPEVGGVQYQQGTLAGYEVREYLLEKWERTCAYCRADRLPLQVEHIVPRARGGSDRVSNLTLACEACNQRKGARTADEFGYPQVQVQALRPLRDAAAVNASPWALYQRLQQTGLPVEVGSGGQTKWNRTQRELPKTHWLDAACVGASTPERLLTRGVFPLSIIATARGTRQMCGTDKYGFPTRHRTRRKRHFGVQTGDLVRAVVPAGLATTGTHVGRVLVRATGRFDVVVAGGGRRVAGISARYVCVCWRRATGIRTHSHQRGMEGEHETAWHTAARSSPSLKARGFPRRFL
jgi:hypothetical protein